MAVGVEGGGGSKMRVEAIAAWWNEPVGVVRWYQCWSFVVPQGRRVLTSISIIHYLIMITGATARRFVSGRGRVMDPARCPVG